MIINYYITVSIYRDKSTRLMTRCVINNQGLNVAKFVLISDEIFLFSIKTQFRFLEWLGPRPSGLVVCCVYSNVQIRMDKVFSKERN